MKPANFLVFLASMAAIPVVMLFFFHLLLYLLRPDIPTELQGAADWVWNYLLYDPGLILPNTDLLDMRGRRHMLDVKRILLVVQQVWWGASAFFLLLLFAVRNRLLLLKTVSWSGYAGLVILTMGGLMAVVNFKWAFTMLHFLLFTEQTWVFPADSLLIQLFPLTYFQQFFSYWLVLCVTAFLGLVVAGVSLRRL